MKRSKTRARGLCAGLLLFVMATSGCGLLMTTAPPAHHESLPMFSCTESNVGPGLDAAVAGLLLLNAGLLAAEDDSYWDDGQRNMAIGLDVGLGVLAAVSSGYGFEKTKNCRIAKEQMMLRLMERNSAPSESILFESDVSPVSDPLEIGERIESQRLRMRVLGE